MGSLYKNIQLILVFLKAPFLVLYINDFSDGNICNIAIFADDTTFYCMYYQTSNLRLQLELASQLESDL